MKNKGISLIVLVVTIIVIIILAGAVILSLTQNNPINEANEAMFKSNIDTYTSEITLYVAKEFGRTGGNFDLNNLNKDSNAIKEVITSIKNEDISKFEIEKGALVYIKAECSENEIKWLTEMGIKEKGNEVIPPVYSYNSPIVPSGFTHTEGTWDTGFVIKDTLGNEFVWVPIDGVNVKYEKNYNYPSSNYAPNATNTTDDTLPSGVTSEQEQIAKYGGFYIARYESGKEGTTIVSKKGATVWNKISYTDAKTKSELMYTSAEVKSGLVTGTMWDSTMKWISNAGINVLNSSAWGNYKDSTTPANVSGFGSLQVTGFSEYWKAKNIYDLAGNTYECTNEINSTGRVGRGGSHDGASSTYPASCRYSYVSNAGDILSFRLALYIK